MAERLGFCAVHRRPGVLRLRCHQPEHLAPFVARKAFIYVFEMIAQVLPLVTFARRLSQQWKAFIDNVAGQFAHMKGYGKDLREAQGTSTSPAIAPLSGCWIWLPGIGAGAWWSVGVPGGYRSAHPAPAPSFRAVCPVCATTKRGPLHLSRSFG